MMVPIKDNSYVGLMLFALLICLGAVSYNQVVKSDQAVDRLGGFVSWDSGLYPGISQPWPQWLDNDTVVFKGDAQGKPLTYSDASQRTEAIIVWHLGDAPVAYSDERWLNMGNQKILCAADGVLVYSVGFDTGSDGKRLLKIEAGPPGKTEERTIEYPEFRPGEGLYPFAEGDGRPCDFYHDPRMTGRVWSVDHDRKFYLDFSHDPVTLQSSTLDKAPIPLPPVGDCIQYHNFSGLFYLEYCRSAADLLEGVRCRPYWTVNPTTAQTKRHCVPFDAALGKRWDQLLPTARGIFFSTSQNMTLSTVGQSGLFWPQSTSGPPVVKGFVQNVSVSPNGCRLAFSYAKTLRDIVVGTWGKYSVVAIDVCQDRK